MTASAHDMPPLAAAPSGASATHALRWIDGAILHGCNIHHQRTVLCATVDLGPLRGCTSARAGPDFARRFTERFCDAQRTPPTARLNQPFFDALRSAHGAPFEEVLLEAVRAVELRVAFARFDFVPIGLARVEPLDTPTQSRQVRLVVESHYPVQSRAAARLALAGLLALLPDALRAGDAGELPDFDTALSALLQRANRGQVSTSTSAIALAAHARGIPCASLGGPHLQLGHGAAQHMVLSSMPAGVSFAATSLSSNKRWTTRRLAQLGLPVTRQIAVASPERALAAAEKLGYPVVVKPQKGNQGTGVSAGIARADDVAAAFARASVDDTGVMVENFVPGSTYRLLVIGGRFVAAVQIVAPTVVGDGTSRIEELIEVLNQDPMRDGIYLYKIKIDDDLLACLERQGYGLTDVLPAGSQILLRTAANVAIGGVHSDVTDQVHASHRTLAERAASAIGLSVAGIDVVSSDIGLACTEAGTMVIEVNARPGLCLHTCPGNGLPRDVGGEMLEQLFPPGTTGRIPTALVIGHRGAGALAHRLDALLQERGNTTGLITRKETRIAGQPLPNERQPLHEALAALWGDPRLQSLVVAVTPRRAVTRGLALEYADVAAVLTPDERDDPAIYCQAVTLAPRVATGAVVVEAGNDTAVRLLQGMLEPARLILVGTRLHAPVVTAHVAAGGTAILMAPYRTGGSTLIRRGKQTMVLPRMPIAQDPDRPGARESVTRRLALALDWALHAPEHAFGPQAGAPGKDEH